mgnify:CR=1 FL=1
MYALVDIDNCFASCERLFRPDLAGRPIVVASNNDGCAVARSAEAKALGIRMGDPIFKLQHLVQSKGLVILSSNYTLYADITSRVMNILEELAPSGVERYSIDEAWINLDGLQSAMSLEEYGRMVRETVLKSTGLTVCVGASTSFTLAKAANRGAKKYPATGGVVDLSCPERQRRLLAITAVEDVWGIGRQLSAKLKAMGIETALQLAESNPKVMRKEFSVNVERTIRELQGVPCFSIEETAPTKKQLICSRSFGTRITTLQDMRQAISEYATRAGEKLRAENRTSRVITVFVRTSPFDNTEPHYSNSATATFVVPTSDTRDLLRLAKSLLESIWRDGYRYSKAGVMLTDFYEPGVFQPSLFEEENLAMADKGLMQAIDSINQKGLGKVWFAGQGIKQSWAMKRERLSPAYTTRWADLPVVR